MRHLRFPILLFFAILLVAGPMSQAALAPCVDVVSDQAGHIVGEPQLARCAELSFEAEEIHHLVRTDAAGHGPSHEPLVLVKVVDASSPALWQAHRDRETLTVVIDFWRTNLQTGQEEKFYVVTLTGAKIEAIEPLSLDNEIPDSSSIPDRERLRITYASMTVNFLPASESHTLSAPTPQ